MAFVTSIPSRPRRNVELALLVLSIATTAAAHIIISLTYNTSYIDALTVYVGVPAAGLIGLHLLLRWVAPDADPVLLPIVATLNGIGLAMIHRLDLGALKHWDMKQLIWTVLGMSSAAFIIFILRDHRGLARYTYTAMAASIVLLLLPLLPVIGQQINGARIWIALGPLRFQPGELAKITLAVFFAGYLVVARDSLSLVGRKFLGIRFPRARDMGPIIVAWAASLGVLIFERDLGTSLLFFGLFVATLYVATERTSWIIIGLLMFLGGAFFAWTIFSHVQHRVDIWLHPFLPSGAAAPGAEQLAQGQYGMSSGGLTGAGFGIGNPLTTPFVESDFIISAIGEELGLTGVFAVLMLYALLCERGLRTAIGVRDGFGKLMASALAFSLALQVFVVVGGVTRLIPLTGLTTPFLAYGGSSLVSNWIIVALLLRISDAARRPSPPPQTEPQPLQAVAA